METNYLLTWDDAKAEGNRRKHRVTFEEAATIFFDPMAATTNDAEHSHGEQRLVTIGQSVRGRVLLVWHTYVELSPSEAQIRLISARRASPKQRRQYEGTS